MTSSDRPVCHMGGGGEGGEGVSGVAGAQCGVSAPHVLHYGTEAGQFVSPHARLLLLLLADDLPSHLPTHGQLSALGRLDLPEDGEDLVTGQVRQSLLILLEGGGEQRDGLQ